MLGAIIGDIIGSTYEFNNVKTTDFELFPPECEPTDDSLMTIAVAQWLMEDPNYEPDKLIRCMQAIGRRYPIPKGGFGGMFISWLHTDNPQPTGSWGNGAGMRVSPVGLFAQDMETALNLAKTTAMISHNHPEGIKGAQAIAAAVFMAKSGSSKQEIKEFIEKNFQYDLNRTIDQIRPSYDFEASCQKSVPEAIIAFMEGNDFEEVIRLAVSLGGDSDTIACMAGAIAGSYYPIPQHINNKCWNLLRNYAPQNSDAEYAELNAWIKLQHRRRNPEGKNGYHLAKPSASPFNLLEIEESFERKYSPKTLCINPKPEQPHEGPANTRPRYTPDRILHLKSNEIFVFGSNLAGIHGGGAARLALERFGAVWGQGVGLQGQSYGIPTMQGGVETIKPYVDEFIEFAGIHPELIFYVTRIGCGIAGFSDEEIAPLFSEARKLLNVVLPESFCEILENRA